MCRRWAEGLALAALMLVAGVASAQAPADCGQRAAPACYQAFALPQGAGRLHYYASRQPEAPGAAAITSALVVIHGHPRDADRSFEAGLEAARRAGRLADTLVIAPLYQVAAARSKGCRTEGAPVAEDGDALWTCAGWLAGEPSETRPAIGAFAALDALVAELARQWPALRTVTLAGFSAGAQMLQHSIGFAADAPSGLRLRHVVADPGSWLYFDPVRPLPVLGDQPADWSACGEGATFPGACGFRFAMPAGDCQGYDDWKYGVGRMPATLGRDAAAARQRYVAAEIQYLEGSLDSGKGRGAFYGILDKSCAAMLQGPFRLQRGVAFARYDREVLQSVPPHPLIVVEGCGHDVRCVLPSDAARPVVFPPEGR
ncbi:MAG: hypothetical protein CGU28_01035 [Candidatus Dactylopiibacterium carminicum]|nr:MAG: hypothetical protein CGU28_01035 [Candidatus Dactylopiibacterium carminicum]